jgi:hypothetical protein
MMNNEKWPEPERRVEDRIRLTVDIEWDSNDGRHPGTLSDLNSTGCFILASGFFTDGEDGSCAPADHRRRSF